MNDTLSEPVYALQPFEPDPRAIYTIETTARLVDAPRHRILVYCNQGLVSPVVDPDCGGFYFNDEAIRVLRRIEYLRTVRGVNSAGIRMICELIEQVERQQAELRFLRQ